MRPISLSRASRSACRAPRYVLSSPVAICTLLARASNWRSSRNPPPRLFPAIQLAARLDVTGLLVLSQKNDVRPEGKSNAKSRCCYTILVPALLRLLRESLIISRDQGAKGAGRKTELVLSYYMNELDRRKTGLQVLLGVYHGSS